MLAVRSTMTRSKLPLSPIARSTTRVGSQKTRLSTISGIQGAFIMDNGWIRINSSNINVAEVYSLQFCVDPHGSVGWMAQANYIFKHLNITRDLENYVCMDTIVYRLGFSASTQNLPPGYLFLCRSVDFHDDFQCFRVPDCPAYWALDPSGLERLTADDVRSTGFPDFHCRRVVFGRCWHDSVYTGIRQFHAAKGFDPYSLEAAVAIGDPHIEIACDTDALLAHLQRRALQDYHAICYDNPACWRPFWIPTNTSVELGSIRYFPTSEYEDSVELSFIPGYQVYDCGWSTSASIAANVWNPLNCDHEGISVLENGWLRVSSADAASEYIRQIRLADRGSRISCGWLAQANHIFDHSGITCNLQDYCAFVSSLKYLELLYLKH
ncbi:hypothetical protein C8R47DRAFT_6757 [Mycena vitilis]|nr:hypothetical protein C8R47DRAFT_6757 [Mycena vitilis]